MPKEKFTTSLIVTATNRLHTGRTSGGTEYEIWQIIATKPDGTPIPQSMNLRAFEDLPKNVVMEVDAELYESERYGNSYTIKPRVGSVAEQVRALGERVTRIEDFLRGRGEFVGQATAAPPRQQATPQQQAAPPPPPPPAPAAPPAPPPPPPPPPSGNPPDDIPF